MIRGFFLLDICRAKREKKGRGEKKCQGGKESDKRESARLRGFGAIRRLERFCDFLSNVAYFIF